MLKVNDEFVELINGGRIVALLFWETVEFVELEEFVRWVEFVEFVKFVEIVEIAEFVEFVNWVEYVEFVGLGELVEFVTFKEGKFIRTHPPEESVVKFWLHKRQVLLSGQILQFGIWQELVG